MKQLLVLKNGNSYADDINGTPITTFAQVNTLAEGAIAYFEKGATGLYTLVDVDAATTGTPATVTAGTKEIILAVGSGDSTIGATITKPINRTSVAMVEEYSAPQKQVSLVGKGSSTANITIPTANLVIGKVFSIEIQDLSEPMFARLNIIKGARYDYVLKAADIADSATALAAIITGWVTAITANKKSIVTAVSRNSGKGMSLAANDYNVQFKALCYEGALGFIIQEGNGTGSAVDTYALSMLTGSGLATQVAALEAAISVEDGNTNQMTATALNVYKKASKVVSGGTYDMYSVVSTNKFSTAFNSENGVETLVLIAVPNSYTDSVASYPYNEANIQTHLLVDLFNQ